MNLVSIGTACSTKHHIMEYNRSRNIEEKEVNFFDWNYSSFDFVMGLLKCDPDILFNRDNLTITPTKSNIYVSFNSLYGFKSIHDLKHNYNVANVDDFIEKYKRRYYRFINLIKEDPNIIFVIVVKTKSERDHIINNQDNFFELIKNINPDNKSKIALINFSNSINDVSHHIDKNVISINARYEIFCKWTNRYTWKLEFIDFTKIFDLLEDIIFNKFN